LNTLRIIRPYDVWVQKEKSNILVEFL
jgi:hypothetical protein